MIFLNEFKNNDEPFILEKKRKKEKRCFWSNERKIHRSHEVNHPNESLYIDIGKIKPMAHISFKSI